MSHKMIYAIYEGEQFIDVGTARELVEKGYYKTIKSLISAEWHSRNDRNSNKHYKEVIKVGYEEIGKRSI